MNKESGASSQNATLIISHRVVEIAKFPDCWLLVTVGAN
jgi:hypothetical protein